MNSVVQWHLENHEDSLQGRYISAAQIAPLIVALEAPFLVNVIGHSVEKRPIYSINIGQGSHKILMWSQMHGNESTTTKAVFDLIKAMSDPTSPDIFQQILKKCTFCIIPQLNPDGATAYSRLNAAGIDLNRDAQSLSQPESKALRAIFDDFVPDVCFNLHGQRTIYGFEATGMSSVLSFLAPAGDVERSVSLSRKRAMSLITHIYKELSTDLELQIGRYDDSFNINCTGDAFVSEGVSTVLFEAGHYPEDYERETVRGLVFKALIAAITGVMSGLSYDPLDYIEIPEHQKCYRDILIVNTKIGTVGVQYEEILKGDSVIFVPKVSEIGSQELIYGHRVIDAKSHNVTHLDGKMLKIGDILRDIKLADGSTITLS